MKKLILFIALGLISLSASAQNDRFFVGGGAGLNFGFDGLKFEDRVNSHNGAGTAGDFYLGGWFGKGIGVRAGYQGFTVSDTYSVFGNLPYRYVHADLLFRVSTGFIPYVHCGWLQVAGNSFAGGAGIMMPIRLGEHFSIVPDIKANLAPGSAYGIGDSPLATTLSATLGIAVSFGKKK